MNTSLASNPEKNRAWHKLETLSANLEKDFQELHEGVKHQDLEKIETFSEKFTKDVMAYIHQLRQLKEKMNGFAQIEEIKEQFQEKIVYLDRIESFIKDLKHLSKTYKQNEIFAHAPQARRHMENEDIRMVELEQAVQATKDIMF